MDYNAMDSFEIKYQNGNIYKGSVKVRVILGKIEKIREGYGQMFYSNGANFKENIQTIK